MVYISSLVSGWIATKFGTDNLSGSEVGMAKVEFENSDRLPWKSGNAGFEVPFGHEGLRFCSQTR